MGIVIKNALAVLPEGAEDVVRETSIYVEKDRIVWAYRHRRDFRRKR